MHERYVNLCTTDSNSPSTNPASLACTAVVTEISYNDDEKPYCAEVEFIAPADWDKELRTLFQDLFDGEGKISRDCTNEDTDAGIAYAKIRAVYPRKTREDIANSSPEMMLREVAHILGTTRSIKASLFVSAGQEYRPEYTGYAMLT